MTLGWQRFYRQLKVLVKSPVFLILSAIGNSLMLSGAVGFYYLEHHINPDLSSFLDALWWAVSTVTTVGYGDVTPVTSFGKILGIFLMLSGVSIYVAFTGVFAGTLLAPETKLIDSEVRQIKKVLRRLEERKEYSQEE